MADVRRYRLDDLRHFASALAAGAGVAPARASALASQLLWFDAAGAAAHGIATLPGVLDAIEAGDVDPKAEGRVTTERNGTAVLDGRRGVPLLVLERAAGLATEKARDAGVGLVRVGEVGAAGSAAGVAAEVAVGPMAALAVGPGPSWTVALPSAGGLPAVFDTAMAADPAAAREALEPWLSPWASVLAPGRGWLVAAVAVAALEPLSVFHGRVADTLNGLGEGSGRLLPGPWEARRGEARERGVAVDHAAWKRLKAWAGRFGVEVPGRA